MSLPTEKNARKERPIASGVLSYFPDAIAEIAHVSYVGNKQHNGDGPMRWTRHLSTDHSDCLLRHLMERGTIDTDGCRHTAKMAWRALALLQIELEEDAPQHDDHVKLETYLDPTNSAPAGDSYHDVLLGQFKTAEVWRADDVYFELMNLGCCDSVAMQILEGVSFPDHLTQRHTPDPGWAYVAGPMRGKPGFNFDAFDKCRDALLNKGYTVISPADMERPKSLERDPQSEDLDKQLRYAVRDSLSVLFVGSKKGTIALLPGWMDSVGATSEAFLSRWVGLKVVDEAGDPISTSIPNEFVWHHD